MSNPPLPPVPASPPISGGVRRHHTISAASRSARANAREVISEETHTDQSLWGEDEPVDEDWVGNLGAVGEKTSLHRQASLPTKYRGFHGGRASKTGASTPKNSLAAITGHEEHEDVWNNINSFQVQDDEPSADLNSQTSGGSVDGHASNPPLSPQYTPGGPSPPPSGANVRRHVSLTYGAVVGGARKLGGSGLKRSGTLQAPMPTHSQNPTPPESVTAQQQEEESHYSYDQDEQGTYDEDYLRQQQPQYTGGRWGSGNEWRTPGSSGFSSAGNGQNANIDDVSRALSALELSSNQNQNSYQPSPYQPTGQSIHPPRFNPPHPPPPVLPGSGGRHQNRGSNGSNGGRSIYGTELDGRKTPSGGYGQGNYGGQSGWESKEHTLTSRTSNPNLQYSYQQGHGKSASSGNGNDIPSVPPIPPQYLNQVNQTQNRMGNNGNFAAPNNNNSATAYEAPAGGFLASSLDVPTLIATKGYNPTNFDTKPAFARYFVIKSYTEDDVHKSLKYEIWSSTDPGNKRLDKAFKEANGRGPVYLFFSVNASGHFCGMAEMLTPVDYTRSSTVWASDKWKGVFKVRWIFVRDIPNANLRHIKLNNTQERKPVTNSRDTQELPPDAGQEMLRIFHSHPARTSLLQDFAFYELQSIQKLQQQQLNSNATSPGQSPNPSAVHSPQIPPAPLSLSSGSLSPQIPQAQVPANFGMTNANALAYQMSPMMQMQMQMGLGMGMGMAPLNMGGFSLPQQPITQAMHQSVLRHTSPAPPGAGQQQAQISNQGGQNYSGASNF
ncbi:hypothetical protein AX16_008900 [Volvariella volvacea WC 439]|nr:hypothetical protein AX16_008900 [Volvariella volvacea WC 439]